MSRQAFARLANLDTTVVKRFEEGGGATARASTKDKMATVFGWAPGTLEAHLRTPPPSEDEPISLDTAIAQKVSELFELVQRRQSLVP